MKPERAAQLRATARCGAFLTPAETLELLDEVERLRDGIETMCHRWRGSTNPALHMERELRSLLQPDRRRGR